MTSRTNDPKRPSRAPVEEGWDDATDHDQQTRPRGGQTLPLGTPRPPELKPQAEPSELRDAVVISHPPRAPMESAIELDDDALMELDEEEVDIKPPPPPPSKRPSLGPVSRRPEAPLPGLRAHDDELVADLALRAEQLEDKGVPVALSRARVELGIALEVIAQDRDEALVQYLKAHEAAPDAEAPLLAARWLTPERPLAPALKLATAHARIATDDRARVERAVQVACLHRSAGMLDDARKGYRQALSTKATHPTALRGLEGVLQALHRANAPSAAAALATHLEDMASAFAGEPRFSAWLQVERAALLDGERKHDAARGALELAMRLDGTSPCVRDAYTRHLLVHRATDALVEAWSQHAKEDTDAARAARFEYIAGRFASERLDDVNQAITLHARAADRAHANVDVRRGALQELSRLHASLGNPRAASEARERHLSLVEEPIRRTHERRRLSETYELLGQHEDVVRHAVEILQFDPDDEACRDRLDRALEALERHEERIDRWTAEAARVTAPSGRAEALVRAARIAERELSNLVRAESLYRAAWAADAGSVDAFDGLSRLLARPGSRPGEAIAEHARARIDLYEQAALSATDKERRIACLEKVAQIWEDELSQPPRALEVYRRLSELDDRRRSTILGLQRCSNLASEYEVLVRSLVREADVVTDASLQRSLFLRAAEVAATNLNDADTAMSLIGRVLSRSPGDPLALRAAWRVNHKTGRFEQALEQLRTLLKHTRRGPGAFALSVEMAVLLEERLQRPQDAVKAYREAAAQDPEHPIPQIEIPRILIGLGEYKKAAEQYGELAAQSSNPYIRARLLVESADIYFDRLDDLDAAVLALTQAHALVPADISIFERLVRVQERRGKALELVPLFEKEIVGAEGPRKLTLQFQLADLLARERDYTKAVGLLSDILAVEPTHVAALRTYEHALRRLERWDDLTALLHHQAQTFSDPTVRLGALYEAYYFEEHVGVGTHEGAIPTIEQIRALAPDDPYVYEAMVRSAGLTGDTQSPQSLAEALARMATLHEQDSFLAATLHLAAALVFENVAAQEGAAPSDALQHYQQCLSHWANSLTAARGLFRVAQAVGDISAEVEAHAVLGRIESSATDRAGHNAAAALAIASTGEEGRTQAFELYSTALRDDPDCGPAARGIVELVDQGVEPGHVADVLRSVLDVARNTEQVVLVGSALGRIATDYLRDPNGAVEALRRVRDKSPGHVPTLLELAEACAALHLWFESAEVAQSVLGISNDRAEHIRALVILAESHSHVQAKWSDARREAVDAELAAEALSNEERRNVSIRLAKVYENLKDRIEQERLICMNLALAGNDPGPLRELAARYDLNVVDGCIAYIQSLNRVLAMVDVLEVPRQPAWLVEVGRLEATRLSRPREGVAKLREAIALEPARIDSTLALADTLSNMGAHEEAASELRSLLNAIDPNTLTSEKIATVSAMAQREFESANRRAQAAVAEEIMGFLGYGAPERLQAIRSRVLPEALPQAMAFDRATLERMLVPAIGQGVMFKIASALEDVAHKLLRIDPAGVGATSAMRLSARSSHPRRQAADRIARAFGTPVFDLYVDVPSLTSPRVLPGSPAAILLPPGFENLPRNEQSVGLARLIATVALGVPWIHELSNDDLVGWMFGALHVGRPGWDGGGLHPSKDALASSWKPLIHKAVSRKTRRWLDEIAEEARLDMEPIAWRHAMHLATWRCAFVVCGDWTSTFNHVWRSERDLSGIAPERVAATMFGHPVLRDLCLWGLSLESTPLLRAAGHTG